MANIDRSKKLLVRVALVCGSTVSTLVGAQTLAMLDQNSQAAESPTAPASIGVLPLPAATSMPTVKALHQAPSIIILRPQPSALNNVRQVSSAPASLPDSQVILPPNPQEIGAPAPVVVQQQQQAPAISSSSR